MLFKHINRLIPILLLSLLNWQAQANSNAVILMYHHIADDTPASTSVTLEQFDAHLDYLHQQNFQVWPLSKLITHWQTQQPIPEKTVILTADDAYISLYTHAFPRLAHYGWGMTVFVNAEPIDKGYRNFMSWQQMRELQQHGFEFANHTYSHSALFPQPNESEADFIARVKYEVEQGQQRLQHELGEHTNRHPALFAYPYGEYNESAANLIQQLGYTAVAQVSGAVNANSDRRALNRFPMAIRFARMEDFRLKVHTHPLPLRQQSPFEPIISQNPPLLSLTFEHPISGLNCFTSQGEPLSLRWISDTELEMQAKQPLKPPRDRYACTARRADGSWYWWGHPWIIQGSR